MAQQAIPRLKKYEGAIALDFFNNYAMVKHMAKELDELLDIYIQLPVPG